MKPPPPAAGNAVPSPAGGAAPPELLKAIHDQGQQTLMLVRSLIDLLMPKEGGRDGPTLEDLLANLLVQQRETIALVKVVQAELRDIGDLVAAPRAPAAGQADYAKVIS